MASFRNLLGLPVKKWDDRAAGQVLTLSDDKEHWEFGTGGGGTASPLTTKGDLYGFDTDNARVPIGTDGQVLVADSSKALGVKWAEGNGIHIDDRVATYADLPSPPTEGTGATYLVDADGLLYVWDGSSWPAEGKGVAIGAGAGGTGYAGAGLTLESDIGVIRNYVAGDVKDGGTPAAISFDQGVPATWQIVVSDGASPIQFALPAALDGLSIDPQSGVLSYDGAGGEGSGRIVVTATDANALQCAVTPVVTIYGASTSRVVQVAHTFASSGNACPAFANTPSPGNTVYAWYFAEAGPAANTADGWDYIGNHQGGREGAGLLRRTVQLGDGMTLPPPVTSSLSYHALLLAEVAHGATVHDNLNQFSQGTTVSWGPVTTVDNGLVLIGAGRLNSGSTPTFTGATALYVGSNQAVFGSAALGWVSSDGMDKNGTVSLGSSGDGSGCIAASVGP